MKQQLVYNTFCNNQNNFNTKSKNPTEIHQDLIAVHAKHIMDRK